jgi:hypothetical protein
MYLKEDNSAFVVEREAIFLATDRSIRWFIARAILDLLNDDVCHKRAKIPI